MLGWVSLPLGVVALSEQVIMGDPPTAASLECAERLIWEAVEDVPPLLNVKPPVEVVVGTGGTATSLAVLDMDMKEYDEGKVQNHRVPTRRVEQLERRLKALTFKERAGMFPLTGGREDVIIPGAIITRVTLKRFGARELVVSDAGLLEGLLLATAKGNDS
jgi:exopolyphosphatase/guanosine-5'-triphosphate,3'-diphosphate pyrophosphatase